MSEAKAIAVIDKENAIAIFTGDGLDAHLEKVRVAAHIESPDTSTIKGRQEIKSKAYKVSQVMARTEEAGKGLGDDLRDKLSLLNVSRNKSKDFLVELRDSTRKPLTDWEKEEELRIAAQKLAAEIDLAIADAMQENELFDLRKEKAEMEAEAERVRIEAEEKAEAERVEVDRVANEKRIAEEATAEAERVAAKKIADAEAEAKQAELGRIAAEQREKVAAEMAEERRIAAECQAKTDRIAAENKAEEDKAAAIKKTKSDAEAEAERVEAQRLAKLEEDKAEADKKAANKAHQRKVNQAALKSFTDHGIDGTVAKGLIELIAKCKIANVYIKY